MIETKDASPFAGVYSTREAALYIRATLVQPPRFPRINTQHVSWWAREGLGGGDFEPNGSSPDFINFLQLVSYRMVAAMRAYGISSRDIRIAHALLRERWKWHYPFAMEPIWVGAPDIFVHIGGTPVAVTRFWQSSLEFMRDFLIPIETGFHGLSFDGDNQAKTWTPSEGVVLNPRLQFGEPCIEGTRVPTETIWAFYQSGDTVDTLAEMYRLPRPKIEAAIAWEEKIARSAVEQGG
jgi:uncharacterized protein (DUF433 family)